MSAAAASEAARQRELRDSSTALRLVAE